MRVNKRIIIAVFFCLLTSMVFWSQSRLPQLNEKAQLGQRNDILGISFDVIYMPLASDDFVTRVAKTSLNWAYTNWKGMTFGLIFAVFFLSLLSVLPKWKTSRSWLVNAIKGTLTGVPLSVCVNCTTPIAFGMGSAGVNLTTVTTTLLSSPTLNVVVLSMAFALLPFHLAMIKVVATLVFLWVVVPAIVLVVQRYVTGKELTFNSSQLLANQTSNWLGRSQSNQSCPIPGQSQSWTSALKEFTQQCLVNTKLVVVKTLPLMILAGILGAALIEATADYEIQALEFSLLTIVVITLIATFLPVPIAFDIVVTVGLIAIGLRVDVAISLMFALGIYSIYPAMVFARYVSLSFALMLFLAVALFSVAVGKTAMLVDNQVIANNKLILKQELLIPASDAKLSGIMLECQQFEEVLPVSTCVSKVLESPKAQGILAESCTEEIVGVALVPQCLSLLEYRTQLDLAINNDNKEACLSIQDEHARGVCWMSYVTQESVNPQAPQWCNVFGNPNQVSRCRTQVIVNRVARIQNSDACDIQPLTHREQKFCSEHLDAVLTSLDTNPASCLKLPSQNQRFDCGTAVYMRQILDLHNYGICQQYTHPELTRACSDFANAKQAAQSNQAQFCSSIHDSDGRADCISQLVATRVNKTINALSLSNRAVDDTTSSVSVLNSHPARVDVLYQAPWQELFSTPQLNLRKLPFVIDSTTGKFESVSGSQLGIEQVSGFRDVHFNDPFDYGRSIASGDINNDWLPDVITGSAEGVNLYVNTGNGFQSQYVPVPTNQSKEILVTLLVDVDNDGWQDIVFSTYGGKIYIAFNEQGAYPDNRLVELESADDNVIATMAMGFADIDRDGDLDFVSGNWSYGTVGGFNPEFSQNYLHINQNGQFIKTPLQELPGETLSVLLSDWDQNGFVDLFIGNDREYPDHIYLNGPQGFTAMQQSHIPATPVNTMGIETADFNNDLRLDYFATDMTFGVGHHDTYCSFIDSPQLRNVCQATLDTHAVTKSSNTSACLTIADHNKQQQCYAAVALEMAKTYKDGQYCSLIGHTYSAERLLCNNLAQRSDRKPAFYQADYFTQKQRNVLLMRTSDNALIDQSIEFGVESSFWSWNAKAADLDNDGFQDLYIGNGYKFGEGNHEIHSNVFYHNQAGKGFADRTQAFGLTEYLNTSNYTYLDYNLDGDIDILVNPTLAQPKLYENQLNTHNSIAFALRDKLGNHFCVGCRITIRYGTDKQQLRELKLSGGFHSFDNPIAYFGLGSFNTIEEVTVFWSTGETERIEGPFEANALYVLTRDDLVPLLAQE